MSLKSLKIDVPQRKRPIDPNAIFQGLTLRGSIQNIWGPQEAALKPWHSKLRKDSDVILQMNTGGGKTLVGLLMAQSLVNETNGHVLYVCVNNQLVEQTLEKARETGFVVSSRYKGEWDKQEKFDNGEAFCITNYATLFNGHSIFRDCKINAVIFDDAHVAENVIRSQYTLEIKSGTELFSKVLHLFSRYFSTSALSSNFDGASAGDWRELIFVPMFVVSSRASHLKKLLLSYKIGEEDNYKYPWEHIKNKLSACCVFISGSSIQITPSILPVQDTSFFKSEVRRIYLTATIPTKASLLRTFGVFSPKIICPSGKSGDAQRLFVFLPGEDDDEEKANAIDLIGKRKACIISPSTPSAKEWIPAAKIFERSSGHAEIQRFVQSAQPEMLALVARYDGIDLPGDACRILVLDLLPKGENLFDRFIDQSIQVQTLRSSHTAIRIVQAIGRIFRSNTDHGVVLLRGGDLKSWLMNPQNRSLFPSLLQNQISLGISLLSSVAKQDTTYKELIDGVLNGDKSWDELYKNYIDKFDAKESPEEDAWYNELLIQERQAYTKLWEGQYAEAAEAYLKIAESSNKQDERLSAWYLHWAGLCFQSNKDENTAIVNYMAAAKIRVELGRPKLTKDILPEGSIEITFQTKKILSNYCKNKKYIYSLLSDVESNLNYGDQTSKAEESLRNIGLLLGLDASTPDKTEGSGPDVLWKCVGEPFGASFEMKTNKSQDGEYTKNDIKDCNDHNSWLETKYPQKHFIEAIVGRVLKISPKANPGEGLMLMEVEHLRDLLKRVKSFYDFLKSSQNKTEDECQGWLSHFGLVWPACLDALPNHLIIDLKNTTDE